MIGHHRPPVPQRFPAAWTPRSLCAAPGEQVEPAALRLVSLVPPTGHALGLAAPRALDMTAQASGDSTVQQPGSSESPLTSGDPETRVSILNSSGQMLVGLLVDPVECQPALVASVPGSSTSPPIVVLCHGFRSSKNSGTLEAISTALRNSGLATFCFDFSGNGESEGEFAVGNYWAEVEDLRSVVQFWRAQGRAVAAIVGHSKGGNVVLLYSSKYKDVPCVVNIAGRCVMERGLKERYGEDGLRQIQEKGFLRVESPWDGSYTITKQDLEQRLATDMKAAATSIPSTCRVLTVHGSEDAVVPVEDAHTFSQLIPNHNLVVVHGGDHRLSRPHRAPLVDAVVPFIMDSTKK